MPKADASRRLFLAGAGLGLSIPTMATAQGSGPTIDLADEMWGLDPTGNRDCAVALERAAAANIGARLQLPPGRFRIDRTVRFPNANPDGRFVPGLRLAGAGLARTIFDSRVAGGPMFAFDYAASQGFQAGIGVELSDFGVRQQRGVIGGSGLSFRSVFNARMSRLHIKGMSGDGIAVICRRGDEDGANMIAIDQVRIEDCGGWGLNAAAEPGFNEISYLQATHLFIQGCGGPAGGGGMRWKGQSLALISSALVLNWNTGLYIPGGAGLANSALLLNSTFENNGGVSWLIEGCQSITGINLQIFVNGAVTPNPARHGILIAGTRWVCSQIGIEGVVMRATSLDRAYTGFERRGEYADRSSIRIDRVNWQNFDHPNQKRFVGLHFGTVFAACELAAVGAILRLRPSGRGNAMPLRLRGPVGGGTVPSDTGEWIAATIDGGGIQTSVEGLAAGEYHAYLYDRTGAIAIDVSSAPPRLDADSGYLVREGAPAYLYLAAVTVTASGAALLRQT